MACFHPLKGFKIGVNPSGKPQYKITSYDTEYVKFNGRDWISCKEPISTDFAMPLVKESIEIPCGHCIGCYLDRSRQWADRCMLEASYHEKNCFITLTIDDEHLYTDKPIYHGETVWMPLDNKNYDDDGVELFETKFKSLRKSDFQKFMKRLRKKLDNYDIKIRFFGCSEYGSKSARPHYHAIIFGYDFSDDRVLYKTNYAGDKLYNSGLLSSCWPFGFAVVADCTWNTCAYVSRYCLKKSDNDMSYFYDHCECEPESVFMSRRPGIARQYFDDHFRDIYKYERIVLGDQNGSRTIRPCRYFDNLYDLEDPEDMQRIKLKRMENLNESKRSISERTDLEYLDYLAVKEYNLHNKAKILKERSVEL